MLRISKLADYSVLIACHMAAQPAQMLSAKQLSEETHIPLPTVSKLLKLLSEAQLVRSVRGVNGGYLLERQPADINVAAVVGAIDGHLAVTECNVSDACALSNNCGVKSNWQSINKRFKEMLSQISIEEMRQPLEESIIDG